MRLQLNRLFASVAFPFLIACCFCSPAAHSQKPAGKTVPGAVSYSRQIWPVLQAKCQACHQPASPGGKLVVTSYADLLKGGEHGVCIAPGKPEESPLLEYLAGKRTLMPKGGPALADARIALFRRWIAEGAQDDTRAVRDPIDAEHPPVYTAPPVITALAYSPDGKTLAISGYREILLHKADGSGLIARLVGKSHTLSSLVYSEDGKLLAAAGGAPARFGEAQFWDTATNKLINAVRPTYDTLFGASLSPDGKEIAFGCSDNSVRVLTVPDGKPILKFDNHSDWVFSTAFAMDGRNLLSAGRDQAIKLILVESGQFIDDINTHTSPIRSLARLPRPLARFTQTGPRRFRLIVSRDVRTYLPKDQGAGVHIAGPGLGENDLIAPLTAMPASGQGVMADVALPASVPDGVYEINVGAAKGRGDQGKRIVIGTLTVGEQGKTLKLQADLALMGGDDGVPRLYKVFRTDARTMNQEDHNLLRTYERQPNTITALAFSGDGWQFAVGTEGNEVTLYNLADGAKTATLRGHRGAIYALAFAPDGKQIATGGFDGTVRLYDLPSGKPAKAFIPVPITRNGTNRTAKH